MAQAEKITFKQFQNASLQRKAAGIFYISSVSLMALFAQNVDAANTIPFTAAACVSVSSAGNKLPLPLVLWFWAIHLCVNDKRGISAAHLANLLDIGYESGWYMLVHIRKAMGQRDANYLLSGLLEMDEGYFGSKRSGGKRGRGTTQNKVVVAISKTEEKQCPMYLRMQQVPNVKRVTLQEFIDSRVKDGSVIECDGYQTYKGLENVTVETKVYDAADGDLRWLHTALSNAKAFLTGTYHGRCLHLQSYLDEFCFRFNRRHTGSQLFARLVRAVALSGAC